MKLIGLLGVLAVPFSFAIISCSSDTPGGGSGSGGGGSAGSGAGTTSGTAGTSPTSTTAAGAAGSTVTGMAGSGGAGGTDGTAGSGGAGGSGGSGGSAGAGGSSGTAGSAGAAGSGGGPTDGGRPGDASASPMMNFFVTSDTSMTANLGGLTGADARCQRLAAAVGLGSKTWHAYLSAATPATNAADRIADGPYYNANGTMLATTKAALHARNGDPALFITEQGRRINGQWNQSATMPVVNEHDILTGTNLDGTLMMGRTCGDWTATTGMSQVGHTDGLGPNMSNMEPYIHWQSVHTGQCGNTTPGGGAGRIYCFVAP